MFFSLHAYTPSFGLIKTQIIQIYVKNKDPRLWNERDAKYADFLKTLGVF